MGGVVPLSEHEQRQLEQIEQALYREDPKFGRLVRSSDPRVHYKRKLAQALIGIVVGAGLLAAGVVTRRVYLEPAGAAILVLSVAPLVVLLMVMGLLLLFHEERLLLFLLSPLASSTKEGRIIPSWCFQVCAPPFRRWFGSVMIDNLR